MAELRLRFVRLSHLGLNEIGQSFDYMLREGGPVMAPTPRPHATDSKVSCYRSIAAEDHLEHEIMSTDGQTALEAR
jgi:hypothetical protein